MLVLLFSPRGNKASLSRFLIHWVFLSQHGLARVIPMARSFPCPSFAADQPHVHSLPYSFPYSCSRILLAWGWSSWVLYWCERGISEGVQQCGNRNRESVWPRPTYLSYQSSVSFHRTHGLYEYALSLSLFLLLLLLPVKIKSRGLCGSRSRLWKRICSHRIWSIESNRIANESSRSAVRFGRYLNI